MKFLIYISIIVLLFAFYFGEPLFDIYQNFGIYFPFLDVTAYLDLLKFVILPRIKSSNSSERLFTPEELKQFGGENAKELYLSILGNVFDVSSAASYYGPGNMYHGFTGKDGSRAFITGDFSETGLIDNVLDLSLQDLRHLKEWLKMYKDKYKYMGKLIGKYYDSKGNPTDYNLQVMKLFLKAEEKRNSEEEEKQRFPPCNVEWSADKGSRVWCSVRSGGIERDWVGVPRKLYIPGTNSYRCACINDNTEAFAEGADSAEMSKYLSEYENCDSNSFSCYVKT